MSSTRSTQAAVNALTYGFLRQHCPASCDKRHLVLGGGWMVTGLLLSQTVCFDQWKRSIPQNRCLPASWQRRWLASRRINPDALYSPRLIQSVSRAPWPRFPAWVEVCGI